MLYMHGLPHLPCTGAHMLCVVTSQAISSLGSVKSLAAANEIWNVQGNGPNSPRMSQQHSKQQSHRPQTPSGLQTAGAATLASGGLSAPSAAALQAIVWATQGIAKIGSADPRQRGGVAAQQPAKHGQGPALEPRSAVDWWQPPVVEVQYEADLELGQGAGSRERQTQQMHRASQVCPLQSA